MSKQVSLESWFSQDELHVCPLCAERCALPTPRGGFVVCLHCGLIDPERGRIGDVLAARADDGDAT